MNSLLKKYLFYNLLGLVLLAIATTVLIVVLNNYQLNKRLKEIDNQNLIIYNFLNSSNFFRNNESESIYEAILSKLEIKNLSILILDNEGNVVIDTKGYDVASGSITPSPLIEIEELGKYSNDNDKIITNCGYGRKISKKVQLCLSKKINLSQKTVIQFKNQQFEL